MPAPHPNNARGQLPANSTNLVSKALWSLRKAWISIALLSCFVNILMLTGPIYMLQVYDRVVTSGSMSTLVAITLLMVLMYAFMGIMDGLRSKILVRVGTTIEKQLSTHTFKLWLKQGLEGPGAKRQNPLGDLSTLQQFLTGSAPSTFFDIPWTPIYILVIFMLDWTLGLFALFGVITVTIIAVWAEKSTRKLQSEYQGYKSNSQEFTRACHRNAGSITAMGMSNQLIGHWQNMTDQGAPLGLKASDRSGGATALSKSYRMLLQSAVLGWGAALAVQQIISPGTMIAGSIILGRALAPIQMVIGQWRGFIAARNALKRLNQFYESYDDNAEPIALPVPMGNLSVQTVTAGPPGAKKATLNGLNFALQPGDAMCVIGPSASGKSTLAKLLVGIWTPQRGTVRLDGATFTQWDRNELGKHIGYLPQQIEMLEGTIAQNIARFSQALSQDIIRAAQMAGIHELILNLPKGYETPMGQHGVVLSVGQTQRLALARAVFGDPCLVVLDEPNSNLDAMGDKALNTTIAHLRQLNKTVIVITHRQSAMAAVNKVLMLKDGKQVRFGNKEELMRPKSPPMPAPNTQNAPAPIQQQIASPQLHGQNVAQNQSPYQPVPQQASQPYS